MKLTEAYKACMDLCKPEKPASKPKKPAKAVNACQIRSKPASHKAYMNHRLPSILTDLPSTLNSVTLSALDSKLPSALDFTLLATVDASYTTLESMLRIQSAPKTKISRRLRTAQ